jgi:L-ascorbate metabolism protein UlaG (beta-lactamase superfamily)
MQVEWYGQSAFRLSDGRTTVFVDPFDDLGALRERGMRWDYPPITGVRPDLVLVTHEHRDHNGTGALDGEAPVLRSTAGRLDSPIGEVLAIASEHDDAAGTERGPNTIFAFELGGLRVAHFGDFGQGALRDAQARALGRVDVLFVPVGGRATIEAGVAAEIAATSGARIIVPMHYRTARIDFLEPVDEFLTHAARVQRLDTPAFDTDAFPPGSSPLTVVPAAP